MYLRLGTSDLLNDFTRLCRLANTSAKTPQGTNLIALETPHTQKNIIERIDNQLIEEWSKFSCTNYESNNIPFEAFTNWISRESDRAADPRQQYNTTTDYDRE